MFLCILSRIFILLNFVWLIVYKTQADNLFTNEKVLFQSKRWDIKQFWAIKKKKNCSVFYLKSWRNTIANSEVPICDIGRNRTSIFTLYQCVMKEVVPLLNDHFLECLNNRSCEKWWIVFKNACINSKSCRIIISIKT